MTVIVFKNFLDKETCDQLNAWVDLGVQNKWLDSGLNHAGGDWVNPTRLTTRAYADRFEYPECVHQVSNNISQFLNIFDLQKSKQGGGKNGIVVSCIFTDGDTHTHIDPKEGQLEVLRCNIMTRKSECGGDLIVAGNKIEIGVGDLHCYLPSTTEHCVTKVSGNTSRIMWMFGYQCSTKRFDQIKQKAASSLTN